MGNNVDTMSISKMLGTKNYELRTALCNNAALAEAMDLIAPHIASVEEKIREQATFFESGIEEYIAYACGSSGKRLRPALALLAGGATGTIGSEHVDLAVILELIHIASLVHDDIMDGADLRRERPTLNAKWGNALTVLVGDVLFTHALRMATHFSKADFCRRIADAAIGVCSGEILQTEHRFDVALSLSDYYQMLEMKTGSLFSVACELGAVLNEATPEVVSALKNYGSHIGTAYQILDDCIDLIGEEKNVGKTLGTDLLGGKFTLPVLMLLQAASEQERTELREKLLGEEAMSRESLVAMMKERGALAAAVLEAGRLIDQAEVELARLSENQYVIGLRALATYLRELLEKYSQG